MTSRFQFMNFLLKTKNDIFSPDHRPLRLEGGLSVTNAVTVSATGRGITTADTGQAHTTGNLSGWGEIHTMTHTTGNLRVGGEIHTMTEETSNDWMTTTIDNEFCTAGLIIAHSILSTLVLSQAFFRMCPIRYKSNPFQYSFRCEVIIALFHWMARNTISLLTTALYLQASIEQLSLVYFHWWYEQV